MKTNAAPYFYPATLDRVIDGDTITCNLDPRFPHTDMEEDSLYGVNSAESRTRDKRKGSGATCKSTTHRAMTTVYTRKFLAYG